MPSACMSLLYKQVELVHVQWFYAMLVPATPVQVTDTWSAAPLGADPLDLAKL